MGGGSQQGDLPLGPVPSPGGPPWWEEAVVAVAHTLLVIVYHLLKGGEAYSELGGNYFDERDRWHVEPRLVRRLEALG